MGYLLCNGLSFCDLVQVRSLSFIPFRLLLILSLFSLLTAAYIGEIIRRGLVPLYKPFLLLLFLYTSPFGLFVLFPYFPSSGKYVLIRVFFPWFVLFSPFLSFIPFLLEKIGGRGRRKKKLISSVESTVWHRNERLSFRFGDNASCCLFIVLLSFALYIHGGRLAIDTLHLGFFLVPGGEKKKRKIITVIS